jgi:hypothetical protein
MLLHLRQETPRLLRMEAHLLFQVALLGRLPRPIQRLTLHIGAILLPYLLVCLNKPFRAAYGYDVNSPEFKQWQAQQYSQYYAAQQGSPNGISAPQPPSEPAAAPPPPPA